MAWRLACSDAGYDCSYVAEGDSVEQVLADGFAHARAARGYTDEQVNDPKVIEQVRAAIRRT